MEEDRVGHSDIAHEIVIRHLDSPTLDEPSRTPVTGIFLVIVIYILNEFHKPFISKHQT